MLEATGLNKSYLSGSQTIDVLRGVNLRLAPGESASITGPSGCGKSTLLHILGALDPPDAGTVTLEGVDPYGLDETAQARFRNAKVGFIFQDHCLLPQLTVLENVLTPTMVGTPDAAAPARARALLAQVGLEPRLAHRPAELSGGEKQRVAIARALIRQPALLLCDEPTGNLDARTAETVATLLEDLCREHRHVLLVVTHSLAIASRYGRRYELKDGLLCDSAVS
jgi:lipoprotein-releasing system ATP-binding protein